jgi:hypothetical protein
LISLPKSCQNTLEALPNVRRFKILLPYQIVATQGSPSTAVLATTFACLAKRNEEHKKLETLVIDYVSDTTINNIFHNPLDLQNAYEVFSGLNNLIISIKRQECRSLNFSRNIWFLIRKATHLQSLCLFGWNTKRDNIFRKLERDHPIDLHDWRIRSLPYPLEHAAKINNLRFLELKRLDIIPDELVTLIDDCSLTLKELYLIEVYLKVNGEFQAGNISLWVGHPGMEKPSTSCWIAQSFRENVHLNLSILRATGLGYDDFERDRNSQHPDYDIPDPNGLNKNLDQRFVEAVMHPEINVIVPLPVAEVEQASSPDLSGVQLAEIESFLEDVLPPLDNPTSPLPPLPTGPADTNTVIPPFPTTSSSSSIAMRDNLKPGTPPLRPIDYDAEIFQLYHNTTSHYKRSIDGYFYDHHEHACRELQNMINVADRGIDLISEEIRSYRQVDVDENTGLLVPPPMAT